MNLPVLLSIEKSLIETGRFRHALHMMVNRGCDARDAFLACEDAEIRWHAWQRQIAEPVDGGNG